MLYEIGPASPHYGSPFDYSFKIERELSLPGLSCSVCGSKWSNTGIQYPCADLSSLLDLEPYRTRWPVNQETLDRLRGAVVPLLYSDALLMPGTEFGPLKGKARGVFGDFTWPFPWTMLVGTDSYDKLRELNVQLPEASPTEIVFSSRKPVAIFVEPQIVPYANLSQDAVPVGGWKTCNACGRVVVKKPARMIVDSKSIPDNIDIFRMKDLTTLILVTERFKEAAERLQLTDVMFVPVDVS